MPRSYDRETEQQFGNYLSSYDENSRVGGRDEPRDQDYFRGSRDDFEHPGDAARGPTDGRELDYDRRGQGQRRGQYADPNDQGHESRDRWQGSGGSHWDQVERRGSDGE